VAMSDNGTVKYLFGDHLGSTNVIADTSGARLSENLYKPWGEDRYIWGTAATTFGFTGQRAERSVAGGLYYYNARWYDSYITQFTQPDSIIPDPYNPLDWNRYAYARYNPVKYTDPTGHWSEWFDYAMGAGSQFVNDMTFGLFYALTVNPENIDNSAYQQGREAGRAAATVVSSTEMVLGTAATAWGLGSMTLTAGGGLAAAIPTGGTSLVIAGVAIPAEAALAGAGALAAGHGFSSMVYMRNHPVGRTPQSQSQIQKSISSLEKNISDHEAKLKAYMDDPYAFDNQKLLRDAPNNEVRQAVINSRINHLQQEINSWRRQVDSLKSLLDE